MSSIEFDNDFHLTLNAFGAPFEREDIASNLELHYRVRSSTHHHRAIPLAVCMFLGTKECQITRPILVDESKNDPTKIQINKIKLQKRETGKKEESTRIPCSAA